MSEIDEIRERYKKRGKNIPSNKYLMTNHHVLLGVQEKERKIVKMLNDAQLTPLDDKKILEVGCGTGSNLVDFIRLGAMPENIVGNELLETRIVTAKKRLPNDINLICGDACELALPSDSFDIVLQSTVFTSILDDAFQRKLADKMWNLTKPGGYIIWFDFIHANPFNKDVRAVPISRVKQLFPNGKFKIRKVILFPFISKLVTKRFFFPYAIFNIFPFLRMHILCFIKKPLNN